MFGRLWRWIIGEGPWVTVVDGGWPDEVPAAGDDERAAAARALRHDLGLLRRGRKEKEGQREWSMKHGNLLVAAMWERDIEDIDRQIAALDRQIALLESGAQGA